MKIIRLYPTGRYQMYQVLFADLSLEEMKKVLKMHGLWKPPKPKKPKTKKSVDKPVDILEFKWECIPFKGKFVKKPDCKQIRAICGRFCPDECMGPRKLK